MIITLEITKLQAEPVLSVLEENSLVGLKMETNFRLNLEVEG
jgi:hypothetical protein